MSAPAVLVVALLAGSACLAAAAAEPAAEATRTFPLPGGHKVVARWAGDGTARVDVVPFGPGGGHGGVEPARDCLNDVPSSHQALAANAAAGVTPNKASDDACLVASGGLQGPLNYLEFHWSGDTGGYVQLWSTDQASSYELYCTAKDYANVGTGFGDAWVFVGEWNPSACTEIQKGLPPSMWYGYTAYIGNQNRNSGAAYALAATTISRI